MADEDSAEEHPPKLRSESRRKKQKVSVYGDFVFADESDFDSDGNMYDSDEGDEILDEEFNLEEHMMSLKRLKRKRR